MVICQVHYMFLDTLEIIAADLRPADTKIETHNNAFIIWIR